MDTHSRLDIGTPACGQRHMHAACPTRRPFHCSQACRLSITALPLTGGIDKLVVTAMTTGYIASMNQSFPVTRFVIAVAIELAAGLLRTLGIRPRLAAPVLAVFFIAAGMVFHPVLGDHHAWTDYRRMHAGRKCKRAAIPQFVPQSLSSLATLPTMPLRHDEANHEGDAT